MDLEQPHLILVDDPALPVYPLAEGSTRIGRASANEISLRHRSVSRLHCTLVRSAEEVRIRREADNPIRVDDETVGATGRPLRDGETIRLGARELIFRWPGQPEPAPARRPPSRREVAAPRRRRGPAVWPVALALIGLVAAAVTGTLALVGAGREERQRRMAEQQAELDRLIDQMRGTQQALATKDRELQRVGDALARGQLTLLELQRERDEALAAARAGKRQATAPAADEESARKLAEAQATLSRLVSERDRLAAERKELEQERERLARTAAPAKTTRRGSVETAGTPQAERAQRKELPAADRRKLVAALLAALDDYANPASTPRSLEPHLGQLTALTSKEAAADLLRVYQHARELLDDLDRNMQFLERKNRAMTAAAAAARPSADGARGRGREGAKLGRQQQTSERNQRLMELYDKKKQIKQAQRGRLVALRDHVCAAFGRMTADEQTRYLAGRFQHEQDPVQRTAILAALEAGRARHAIPLLIGHLSLRDEQLKQRVHRTLARLAGVDPGPRQADWQQWWKQNKDL